MGGYAGFWRPQCVDLLLTLGANPNTVDTNGLTPLYEAASSAHITKSLLRSGAELSAGKISPIFNAIFQQNVEVLAAILDAGGDVNAVTDPFSIEPAITDQARTALFCASFALQLNRHTPESVPLIKLLIQRGADMYAALNDRETLVHYVFEHGAYEAVCAFLDCHEKINLEARDQLGRTVLLAACNWTEVAPGYNHKHWYAKEPPPVMRLLEYGADIMALSNDGKNVLHHLLDNPDIEQDTIMQLIDQETEACKKMLKHKDHEGYTPFHSALRVLRPDICFKLLSLGADILTPDPTGATALHHIAAQYLQRDRPQRGLHLTQKHSEDHHARALALYNRYLALNPSSINIRDATGSPPLFAFLSSHSTHRDREVKCCHLSRFPDLFSSSEVDLAARNNDGETALHVIARRENGYGEDEGHDRLLMEFFVKHST
jgi:ankyrin repeat protein